MLDLTNTVVETDLLVEGEYAMQVEDAEIKETKAGTGEYISVKLKVLEGTRKGKTVYHMFNIKNPNPEAVRIGHQQLKSFMMAAGFSSFVLKSASDLCGATVVARVKIKKDDTYGDKNNITGFKSYTGAQNEGVDADSIPF
jgi:hypothetical protein